MNPESEEQTRPIVNKKKEIKIRVEVSEIETGKISKTKSYWKCQQIEKPVAGKNKDDTEYQNQEWREDLVLILQNLNWYLVPTKLDTLGEMDRILGIDRLAKLTQEWKVWMDI